MTLKPRLYQTTVTGNFKSCRGDQLMFVGHAQSVFYSYFLTLSPEYDVKALCNSRGLCFSSHINNIVWSCLCVSQA